MNIQHPPKPNWDMKDMEVLCTFKINVDSQKSDHGYIKDKWLYPKQDLDSQHQSWTSSFLENNFEGINKMMGALEYNGNSFFRFWIWVNICRWKLVIDKTVFWILAVYFDWRYKRHPQSSLDQGFEIYWWFLIWVLYLDHDFNMVFDKLWSQFLVI